MSRLPDGNYAIALTPLTEDGELDLNEYAVSKKLAGVVVLGSNSEGPYLTAADDMQSLYRLARERKLEEAFAVQEKIRRGGCALFSGLDADPEIIKDGFMAIFNAPSASEIIHHTKPAHHLVKEALRLKGLAMSNQVRLPYLRANAKQSEWVKKLLADFGWLGL